jgi:hypothetical protein
MVTTGGEEADQPEVVSLAGFERPEPLRSLARRWPWARWLVGGVIVARFVAVAGMRLYLYFDSAEYDRIDFSGHWRRPWATPFLYGLLPGEPAGLVVGQAMVGAICWSILALSAAAWFRFRRAQIVVAVTFAALGCTTIVTNWDAAKLSESLGVSLTVLVLAAWLNFLRRTELATAMLVALATLPWLFVRQSLITTAWLAVAAAGIGAFVVWRRRSVPAHRGARMLGGLCLALVVLTGAATASYSRNQEILNENLLVIVANRIATNPDRLVWFTTHGMPLPPAGGLDTESLRSDPAFSRWVAHDGRSTYLRFLITHPKYALTEPFDDFAGVRQASAESQTPSIAMLAPPDSYASSRPVLPGVVEQVLFQPGDTGMVIAGLLVVGGWSAARWRRRSARWTVSLVVIGLSVASLYAAWHGATPELGRVALIGALGLRIGLLLQLAFLAEDELLGRLGRI